MSVIKNASQQLKGKISQVSKRHALENVSTNTFKCIGNCPKRYPKALWKKRNLFMMKNSDQQSFSKFFVLITYRTQLNLLFLESLKLYIRLRKYKTKMWVNCQEYRSERVSLPEGNLYQRIRRINAVQSSSNFHDSAKYITYNHSNDPAKNKSGFSWGSEKILARHCQRNRFFSGTDIKNFSEDFSSVQDESLAFPPRNPNTFVGSSFPCIFDEQSKQYSEISFKSKHPKENRQKGVQDHFQIPTPKTVNDESLLLEGVNSAAINPILPEIQPSNANINSQRKNVQEFIYDNDDEFVIEVDQTLMKFLSSESLEIKENCTEKPICLENSMNINVTINISVLNREDFNEKSLWVGSSGKSNQIVKSELNSDQQQKPKMINQIYTEALALIDEQQQLQSHRFREKIFIAKHSLKKSYLRNQGLADGSLNIDLKIDLGDKSQYPQNACRLVQELNYRIQNMRPMTEQGKNIVSCVQDIILEKFGSGELETRIIPEVQESDGNVDEEEVDIGMREGGGEQNSKSKYGQKPITNSEKKKSKGKSEDKLETFRENIEIQEISGQYEVILGQLIEDHQKSKEELKIAFSQALEQRQTLHKEQSEILQCQIKNLKQQIETSNLEKIQKDEIDAKHNSDLRSLENEYLGKLEELQAKLAQTRNQIDEIIDQKQAEYQEKLVDIISQRNKEIRILEKQAEHQISQIRQECEQRNHQIREFQETVSKEYTRFNSQLDRKNADLLEREKQIQTLGKAVYNAKDQLGQSKGTNINLMKKSEILATEVYHKEDAINFLSLQLDYTKDYIHNMILAKQEAEKEIIILEETNQALRNQIIGYLSRENREREMHEQIAQLKSKLRGYQQLEQSMTFNHESDLLRKNDRQSRNAKVNHIKNHFENRTKLIRQKTNLETVIRVDSIIGDQIQKIGRISKIFHKENNVNKSNSLEEKPKISQKAHKYLEKQDVIAKKHPLKRKIKVDRQLQDEIDHQLELLRRKKEKYQEGIYSPKQYRMQQIPKEQEDYNKGIQRWKSSQNLGQALSQWQNRDSRWEKLQKQTVNRVKSSLLQSKERLVRRTPSRGFNPANYDLLPSGSAKKQFSILGNFISTKLSKSRIRSNSSNSFEIQ